MRGAPYTRTMSSSGSSKSIPSTPTSILDNSGLNVESFSDGPKSPAISDLLEGRRVVDLGYVLEQSMNIAEHFKQCTSGRMMVVEDHPETRLGLYSIIHFRCDACGQKRELNTARPPEGRNAINKSYVWGAMAVGIGHSQAEEMFAIMDVPVVSAPTFKKYENEIGKVWETSLAEQMAAAIDEEKGLAIARGDVTRSGIPFITVIVDGGWGKRSYGHNYSSSSGVAVVIGKNTGKLLYLGVKNKFCYTCAMLKKKPDSKYKADHKCTKSYTGPSTGMEQSIIVEGLKEIYQKHRVWVKFFIGDGDSSVFARIREFAPFGALVEKVECANQVTRNYTSKLHALRTDTKIPLDCRKELAKVIPRLSAAVRGAIRTSAEEGSNVDQLRKDLTNGPRHVFGDHAACRTVYCVRQDINESNLVPLLKSGGLFEKIEALISPIAQKADRLKTDATTNLAEHFMSRVAKFVGGKRVDFSKGASYGQRCLGAGLAFLGGPSYSLKPLGQALRRSPGRITKRVLERREVQRVRRRLEMSQLGQRPNRKWRGQTNQSQSYEAAEIEYGPNCAQPDMTDVELENKMAEKLQILLKEVDTPEKQRELERSTRGQSHNVLWREKRLGHITASSFGRVYSMRDTTSVQRTVRDLVAPKDLKSDAIVYGRLKEPRAIEIYEGKKEVQVDQCGLFVSRDYPFWGASPDGLVGNSGLVEVKCLFSLRNKSTILDAARKRSKDNKLCVRFIQRKRKDSDGPGPELVEELAMKEKHPYHYQILGQLAITGREYCDLVLFTDHQKPLSGGPGGPVEECEIVRVYPNPALWQKVVAKLERFYRHCLLPELVDGRTCRGMKVREPYWYVEATREKEIPPGEGGEPLSQEEENSGEE